MTIEAHMQGQVWVRIREAVPSSVSHMSERIYAEVHGGIDVFVDWQVSGRMWEWINA